MPEGKHAGQRIKENLQVARAQTEALRLELLRGGASDRPFVGNDESMDYALFRAFEASTALHLFEHEYDEAIAKAFSEAKLNPENPWHWRVLLNVFAEAYFPPRNSNRFWNYARLTELAAEDLRLQKTLPSPKKEHRREARRKRHQALIKWVEKRYDKRIKLVTLSKLLRQANDRKINKYLESIYQEILGGWADTLAKHKDKILDADQVIESMKIQPSTMELTVSLAHARLRTARIPEPDKG